MREVIREMRLPMARGVSLNFDPLDPLDRGDYLRLLLRRKSFSLDDAVELCGVSKGLICAFLNGRKHSDKVLLGLCSMLDENPELFSETREERTPI